MNKYRKFLNTFDSWDKRFMSNVRRKYPINTDEYEKLPIHQYITSKKNYRRLYAWGNIQSGALGIPYLKSKENIDKLQYIRFPKRVGFGEKIEVTTAACGFGFTVFGVNSGTDVKIYGTGINTDSQIGYHDVRHSKPLGLIYYPRPISLPLSDPVKSRILKLAAGRAHVLVLTDEGIFTLGNNAYGQCGRKIVPDENYSMSNYIHHIKDIDGKKIVDVECGQDHSLVLLEDGSVYSCGWGADGQTGLGDFENCQQFSRVRGDIESERIVKLASRSDFVLALNDKGEVFGWGNIEYGQITQPNCDQQLPNPMHIQMLDKLGKIRSIASAGSFCAVVNENHDVYTWGYGLLGAGPEVQLSKVPIHIPSTLFGRNDYQNDTVVESIECGLNYAAAVTNLGDLYVWGRNQNCSLGLGHEKDQYFPLKVSLGGFVEKVFCGIDHTIALCKPFI